MLNVIFRTLVVYFTMILLHRLLGKRQLGEMELSEFVVAALMANLAAHPLQEHDVSLLLSLVPILVLAACEIIIALLSLRHIRLRSLMFGRPSLIVDHGRLNQREMRRNRYTVDELMQAMRGQGILDIAQVRYAVLETNGVLSVIPNAADQPVTPAQMEIDAPEPGYPSILISEGRVLDKNLRRIGFDRSWLTKQLRQQGLSGPEEVFLFTSDESGSIFCAPLEKKEDSA